jgi:sugar phosphate isomerase/epimerase
MSSIYAHPAVRKRLVEFLGGATLAQATAAYIAHSDGCPYTPAALRPPADLDYFLARELDVARSLADAASHLFHLDVEYVNFDAPAEAFVDPWRTFDLQEPVVHTIETLLLEWGIRPLHLITGQGHHFVWSIPQGKDLAVRLANLCPAPELLQSCQDRVPPAFAAMIDLQAHRVFAATSLLMEYVAHRVKEAAGPVPGIPVETTAVHVGPTAEGRREIISVDISEYGDPLQTRMIRMPFSIYLKPWVSGLARSLGIEEELPALRTIPLHEIDIRQAIKMRQVDKDVIDLACRAPVTIPEQEAGTERLLRDYLTSPLRQFHERFYADQHDARPRWPQTYDRTPMELFPACARHVVTWPNDLLLKPAGMQLVTRCLLAGGWHPRHIAGFIRSKFENPLHQWGNQWDDFVPAIRADFYTRLFAGLYETGLDPLIDFNCTSIREKGFCFTPGGESPCTLEPYRARLAAGKDPAPGHWPIGLSTGCFYRHPILNVLESIRRSGFQEIEVCSFPAHLNYHHDEDVRRAGERIRSLELRALSFHAPFADRIDITSPDESIRRAAVAELLTACRAAALLGAENVVLHPGPERSGRPPEEEFQQRMHHAAASLNEVAAECCRLGVQLLLENMLPHLLFGHTSDMMYLLGSIDTCSVGTCLDTGHALLSGDLGDVFHKLSRHLKMVHINDNHGDWDAHLLPGEGSIDWLWVTAELHRQHFTGGLIIEMAARDNESVSDTLARACRGRDFLRSVQPSGRRASLEAMA